MPEGVGYGGAASLLNRRSSAAPSFAAPLLAYAVGQDINQGRNQADEDRERAEATQILSQIVAISEHDPVTATKIMAEESARLPQLAKFKGMTFNAPSEKGFLKVGDNLVHTDTLMEGVKSGDDATIQRAFIKPKDGGRLKALGANQTLFQENVTTGEFTPVAQGTATAAGGGNVNDLRKQLNGLVKSRADIFQKARTGFLTPEESRRNLEGIDQRIRETQQALDAATGQPQAPQATPFGQGGAAGLAAETLQRGATSPYVPGQIPPSFRAPAGAASLSPTGLTKPPSFSGQVGPDPLNLGL